MPATLSYSDQVSLAGIGPVEVELGSIQSQTSNFDQFKEIDGVVGFTMGGKSNVFAQLVDAGLCANVSCLLNLGCTSCSSRFSLLGVAG